MKLKTNLLVAATLIFFIIGVLYFFSHNVAVVQIETSNDKVNSVKAPQAQEPANQTDNQVISKSKSDTPSCLTPESMFISSKKNIEKKADLVKVLQQLNESNSSRKVIDTILINSGIGLNKGHRLLKNNDYKAVVTIEPSIADKINVRQAQVIKKLIDKNDLNGFLALYLNNKLSPKQTIMVDYKPYTPLQTVLLIHKYNKEDDTKTVDIINTLMDVGISVQLADIVEYTAKGASTDILYTLSNNYPGNTNQTFFYGVEMHTLVSLSVKQRNVDNLIYWLSENINPSPLKYRANAFDYVVNTKKSTQLEEIVSLLLDYGVVPNQFSTFDFLIKNLSPKYQDKTQNQLKLLNYKNLTL